MSSLAAEITLNAWLMAFTAAVVLGISKAGIKGIAIISVTLMALAFGAKESTGVIMPLLIFADIFAVIYYNKHAKWNYLVRFLPWMMVGVIIGALIGKDLDEKLFKVGMAIIILGSVLIMYWWDRRRSKVVPTHWAFAGGIGIMAGITTMIGNLAGGFYKYFLFGHAPS